jgi:hypothetical protein
MDTSLAYPEKEAALLSFLYKQLGQVIDIACFRVSALRFKGLHLLRQYIVIMKEKLRRSDAPYVITRLREFVMRCARSRRSGLRNEINSN